MKTKCILPILFAIFFVTISLSCATAGNKTPDIDPATLVGTKWVTVLVFFGTRSTVEFIDETHLIYTLATGPREMTYKIKGNKIIVNRGSTYELRGNIMYFRGNPYFLTEEHFNSLVDQITDHSVEDQVTDH